MCRNDEVEATSMVPPRFRIAEKDIDHDHVLHVRAKERWGELPAFITLDTDLLMRRTQCSKCREPCDASIVCTGCLSRQYCSLSCKDTHWNLHQNVCGRPPGPSYHDRDRPEIDRSLLSFEEEKELEPPEVRSHMPYLGPSKACLGRKVLGRVFFIVTMALELFDCGDPICARRKTALLTVVPDCHWKSYRDLAIAAFSCRLHTQPWKLDMLTLCLPFFGILRASDTKSIPRFPCVDVHGVLDILRWASWCTWRPYIGDKFAQRLRGYDRKPDAVTELCRSRDLCPSRLWNIAIQSKGAMDVGPLVAVARHFPPVSHKRHFQCTEQVCFRAHENSTQIRQAHKCPSQDCGQYRVPVDLLNKAYHGAGPHDWRQTAWVSRDHERLCAQADTFVAISHVWSDGTGAGIEGLGRVNSCLYELFADTSERLGCAGFWWDTICLPTQREPRRTAMNVMLDNYERAKYTIIHEQYLTEFEWKEDGSPAVALILSAWFTRGWTAAELYASRSHPVKVFFKDPGGPGLVLKDLDHDVLVSWPDADESGSCFEARFVRMEALQASGKSAHLSAFPQLGHFVASNILRVLRSSEFTDRGDYMRLNLGEIVRLMKARTTSWARDGLLIAGMLCLPSFAFDSAASSSEITQQILKHLGAVSRRDLLHGAIPVSTKGPWSWCPPSIYDLSKTYRANSERALTDDCKIDESGRLLCYAFGATPLSQSDVLFPFGTHPALVKNIDVAQLEWRKCLILAPFSNQSDNEYILALPVRILDPFEKEWQRFQATSGCLACRWVGCVRGKLTSRPFTSVHVVFGDDIDETGNTLPPLDAEGSLKQAQESIRSHNPTA
ncbi:hypothetical protein K431DRAFT_289288 [Polychaeton citri CBS 116435]|uniref:MYND-type domain-containing protein n=1 Tax=Polychaeton citri CBS 116435 TaxID=1314669 RepID=A0A9P4Q166_9PEZI|nr:hypothetical protein K431DRAFT_289288 [Polychaeton citri CBS 116435]